MQLLAARGLSADQTQGTDSACLPYGMCWYVAAWQASCPSRAPQVSTKATCVEVIEQGRLVLAGSGDIVRPCLRSVRRAIWMLVTDAIALMT